MKKPDTDNVIEQIRNILQNTDASRAVLFGSRAKGTFTERSDIDVVVEGVSDFNALRDEIDRIPTLLIIDLLNRDKIRNKNLLRDIELYGKEIYRKI